MVTIPGLTSHHGLNALDRFVRLPLRLIPKSWEIPVLSGPNKGYKWRVGAGIHGCWIGSYEKHQVLHLGTFIRPGMTIFDAGAHAGYYSLAMSRMTGPSGKVIAFEPNANNQKNLRRHIAVNGIRNIEVIDAAVSRAEGHAYFGGGEYVGRLAENVGTRVRTVALDDFGIPDLIKMDIEGAEVDALAGAQKILAARKTIWFIATHGEQRLKDCQKILSDAGYAITHQHRSDEFCAVPR